MYFLHDLDHYRMGEFLPWRKNENGQWEMIDEEEYLRMMAWTEAVAVHFSDVTIPRMLGMEQFSSIINPESKSDIIIV